MRTSFDFHGGEVKKLNVGCGKMILPKEEGWINLDLIPGPGVDIAANVANPMLLATQGLEANQFDEILLSHVFEHLVDPLTAMQNLWTLAKPGAHMTVRCPWGGNHIAFEDPTHVRAIFLQSLCYFSQSMYNAADYGYRGDWNVDRQIIVVDEKLLPPDADLELVNMLVRTSWNIGVELIAEMTAIKPARPPGTPSKGFKLEYATTAQMLPRTSQNCALVKTA